jgi:activator of 2-hydroxyglutaryl-CoA dehydratase
LHTGVYSSQQTKFINHKHLKLLSDRTNSRPNIVNENVEITIGVDLISSFTDAHIMGVGEVFYKVVHSILVEQTTLQNNV